MRHEEQQVVCATHMPTSCLKTSTNTHCNACGAYLHDPAACKHATVTLQAHMRSRMRTHTRARAHTHAHTHIHTHNQTHTYLVTPLRLLVPPSGRGPTFWLLQCLCSSRFGPPAPFFCTPAGP